MVLKLPKLPKLPPFFSKVLSSFQPPKTAESTSRKTVGLNIGRENIVVSEISFAPDNKLILEQCGRGTTAAGIKTLLHDTKITTKAVRMSLKGQGVVIRYLTFPRMSRADFTSSIQFEAEKYLPFSLSEVVLDYHIIDGAPGAKATDAMNVILVAARKAGVEHLTNLAQENGLKLHAIDLDVFALVNTFYHSNPSAKTSSLALIDFGASDTALAILNKGDLVFSRDVAFGGNDFKEAMQRKLNISAEEVLKIQHGPAPSDPAKVATCEEALERLFQELSSSLTYYYDQHQDADPIGTVYISGGFSQFSLLPALLEKHIQAAIKNWDPTAGLVISKAIEEEKLKELIPYLPVSIGLAVRPK